MRVSLGLGWDTATNEFFRLTRPLGKVLFLRVAIRLANYAGGRVGPRVCRWLGVACYGLSFSLSQLRYAYVIRSSGRPTRRALPLNLRPDAPAPMPGNRACNPLLIRRPGNDGRRFGLAVGAGGNSWGWLLPTCRAIGEQVGWLVRA